MKSIRIILSAMIFCQQSLATDFVIKSPEASVIQYQTYLQKNQLKSYVDFIQSNRKADFSGSDYIDTCLVALDEKNKNSDEICFSMTKKLSQNVWNKEHHAILQQYFHYLSQVSTKHKQLYKKLTEGLDKNLNVNMGWLMKSSEKLINTHIKTQINQKYPDALLLLNGVSIEEAEKIENSDIYQWSFITNEGVFLKRIDTWAGFQKELSNLSSTNIKSCDTIAAQQPTHLNSNNYIYFHNPECIKSITNKQEAVAATNKSNFYPDLHYKHKQAAGFSDLSSMDTKPKADNKILWGVAILLTLAAGQHLQNKQLVIGGFK